MTQDLKIAAVENLVGSGLTTSAMDNAKAVLLWRLGDPDIRRTVLEARVRHRDWLSITQRRWQSKTRRSARTRHLDSIYIREGYVRCQPR